MRTFRGRSRYIRNTCFFSDQSDSLARKIITTPGPDSVVSIVSRYGLDSPVFEPRWKIREICSSKPAQSTLGPNQPLEMSAGALPGSRDDHPLPSNTEIRTE